MLLIKANTIKFIALSCLISSFALSRVAAQEAASGAGETKAESADAPTPKIGPDREWAQRKSRLDVHEAKRKELNKTLQKLIVMKTENRPALDDKGKPMDVLSTIVETHKKLKDVVQTYNTEKNELSFRYPEAGTWIERKYLPMRLESLEEIEKEMGLDGELTNIKLKIDKKYATFVGDDLKKPEAEKASGTESTLKNTKPKAAHDKNAGRIKLSQ